MAYAALYFRVCLTWLLFLFISSKQHGGRDRHFCIGVHDISPLVEKLKAHNITYTMSMSGRPAVFFRDPGGWFKQERGRWSSARCCASYAAISPSNSASCYDPAVYCLTHSSIAWHTPHMQT
jgi:hypothetical protein